MSGPFLASITLLGSGAQPKEGNILAVITPLSGERPGHDLPSGGYPSHGLPEGPVDPGWGNIGAGPRPGHDLPYDPARPDNGVPVPPTVWPPGGAGSIPLPPDLENQVIIAVHRPGVTEWAVKAYPVPEPK